LAPAALLVFGLILLRLFLYVAVSVTIRTIFRACSVTMRALTAIGVVSVATAITAIDLAMSVTSVATFSHISFHFVFLL
jgi:hypothetical protein